jgi:ribosomal protein L25 (general stress protein Ctc)
MSASVEPLSSPTTASEAKTANLDVQQRDETLNPRALRRAGLLPGTLYGPQFPSVSVQVKAEPFERLYGREHIQIFRLEGLPQGPVLAKAHQVQIEPIAQRVLNIEFLLLNANPA